MLKTDEYRRDLERLLESLGELAESLIHNAPSQHSKNVHRRSATNLLEASRNLRAAVASGATRAELAVLASDLTEPLQRVGAASVRGEVAISRGDLLSEVEYLRTIFRDSRYRGIP